MNNHRRHTELPVIPKPEHRENPDVEQLTAPHQHADPRPKMIKPYENVPHAQLNRLYGTLRIEDGWQHVVDNFANGGITSIAGQQVAAKVTLGQALPELRLSRWPGAISMYLAIRSFSIALSTATLATAGSLDVYYQDTIGGLVIPLGSIPNNDELNLNPLNILIPTPITDPGITTVGNVLITLSGGATVGTYVWQIGFSYAYLLPTTKPYDVQHVETLLDGHPGHTR